MMMDRRMEVRILLERLFGKYNLALIRMGHLVKDEYALRFNENGYDENYNRYDPDTLLDRLSEKLSDNLLLRFVNKEFKDSVYSWAKFCGSRFKYDPVERTLKIENCWPEIREKVERYIMAHGNDAYALLGAVHQICVKERRRWDNYWQLHYEAKRRGLTNWIIALAGLERTGIIERHKGDIWVPEELVQLLEEIVKQHNIE